MNGVSIMIQHMFASEIFYRSLSSTALMIDCCVCYSFAVLRAAGERVIGFAQSETDREMPGDPDLRTIVLRDYF